MPEKRVTLNHVTMVLVEEWMRLTEKKEIREPEKVMLATSVMKTKPPQRYASSWTKIRCFNCNRRKNITRQCRSALTNRWKIYPREDNEQSRSGQRLHFGSRWVGKHGGINNNIVSVIANDSGKRRIVLRMRDIPINREEMVLIPIGTGAIEHLINNQRFSSERRRITPVMLLLVNGILMRAE